MAAELAKLQAGAKPTMGSVLGQTGTQIYGIIRGLLISAMGLVMFSAAGALVREALPKKADHDIAKPQSNTVRVLHPKSMHKSTLRGLWGAVAAIGKGRCETEPKIPREAQVASPKSLKRA
jgi:hypothetical protein